MYKTSPLRTKGKPDTEAQKRILMSIFDNLKSSPEETLEIKEERQAIGTSVDTIKSRESKRRTPTGLEPKVLLAIQKNPELYRELSSN